MSRLRNLKFFPELIPEFKGKIPEFFFSEFYWKSEKNYNFDIIPPSLILTPLRSSKNINLKRCNFGAATCLVPLGYEIMCQEYPPGVYSGKIPKK